MTNKNLLKVKIFCPGLVVLLQIYLDSVVLRKMFLPMNIPVIQILKVSLTMVFNTFIPPLQIASFSISALRGRPGETVAVLEVFSIQILCPAKGTNFLNKYILYICS